VTTSNRYFAPCPRGLEETLVVELSRLGALRVAAVPGGVGFGGDLAVGYRANLESRVASRILLSLGEGRYANEQDIYAFVKAIDWPALFSVDRTLRVDVSAIRSPLRSLEFATLRVKDAICDRFREKQGVRPSVDTVTPDVRVQLFLTVDSMTLYLDLSGDPLFKRGWREDSGEAPLRENLAAGMVALSGWQPGTPFLDPMCGSGTIAIEAAPGTIVTLLTGTAVTRTSALSRFPSLVSRT
jgi:putative N6-adenine-specific DNA methylase